MNNIIKESGKECKMFIDKNLVDTGTIKQIRSMIKHPSIENARIMPDCHKGHGCCIGFTSKLMDKIVPNFVGGDIGCGIVSYPISNEKRINVKSLDNFVKNNIPIGSGSGNIYQEHIVTDEQMKRIFDLSNIDADNFTKYYQEKFNVNILPFKPSYNKDWYYNLSKKINTDKIYDLRSLGTLGGGNHFIEVNKSQLTQESYITIHSGSRNLGQKICKYHQNIIFNGRQIDWDEFDEKVKKFKKNNKNKKELQKYQHKLRTELLEKRHPDYLVSQEAFRYYFDMIFAQKYALVNREIMLTMILNFLDVEFKENLKIESIHNYIDFNNFILRKGAISANENELCLISLNMKDGILLCRGKGNEDWNKSCAHGAGRILTRQQASQKLSLKEFKKSMENVYSTSISQETIDESPVCYKDSELIKELIIPSVEIIEQLYPILNIKGN